VLAVLTGTLGAAAVMFFSAHDLTVVLIIAAAAGTAALGAAAALGHSLVTGSLALREAARAIGAGEPVSIGAPPVSAELAALSRELEAASGRLAAATARERALEASRRDLIAGLSHDLRTPLAGLRAMAEALEDGVSENPARYHRQIGVEVDRLSAMVDDLFRLSRISAGSLQLALEPVSLAEIVEHVTASVEPLARGRRVQLSTTATVARPVQADSAELSRALTNLLDNAIRYTPDGGAVSVVASQNHDHAVLAITDQCGGIPDSELDKVFDVAWRGATTRRGEHDQGGAAGTGLGLAIARGIVQAHHGQISVTNVDGGCRFQVQLPAAPEETLVAHAVHPG
jgi:signal transduction histidine kinase